MTKRLAPLSSFLQQRLSLVFAASGLTLLAGGLAMVYFPLALIAPGGLLVALAIADAAGVRAR